MSYENMKKFIKIKEFLRKLYQKKGIRFAIYSLMILGIPFAGAYAHFVEPRRISITKLRIPIKKLPKPFHRFKIIQISDLHFGPTNKSISFLEKCIRKMNELKPDIVAMTGDFMQWDSHHAKPLAQILSKIKSTFGLFAILGNHDYGVCHKGHPATDPVNHKEVIDAFEAHKIQVLHNKKIILEKDGHKINVAGLGDFWTEHFKPNEVLKKKHEQDHPTILLSHNPDSIDELKDYFFDLMLSGHVHGGQINFPFIGPLTVPVKHRHLRRGLHHVHNRWIYTNRGLGHIFKARFNSLPEITCMELVESTG